jgi:hypothetical protein
MGKGKAPVANRNFDEVFGQGPLRGDFGQPAKVETPTKHDKLVAYEERECVVLGPARRCDSWRGSSKVGLPLLALHGLCSFTVSKTEGRGTTQGQTR